MLADKFLKNILCMFSKMYYISVINLEHYNGNLKSAEMLIIMMLLFWYREHVFKCNFNPEHVKTLTHTFTLIFQLNLVYLFSIKSQQNSSQSTL